MKKDCTGFENRLDDLLSIHTAFCDNASNIKFESIELMACLICKNLNGEAIKQFIRLFSKLTSEDPINPLYWFALARIYAVTSVFNKAEDAYALATTYDPTNISYLEYFARYYLNCGYVEQALVYFNRALDCGSKNQEKYDFECGKAYFRRAETAKAKGFLEKCRSINDEDYFLVLAKCCYQLSDFSSALIYSQKGLDLNNSIELKTLYADSLFEIGNYHEALQQYKILLLETGDEKGFVVSIGACNSNLGYYAESIEDFDKAIEYDPTNITALTNKAKTLLKIDNANLSDAISIYINIIELFPDNLTTLQTLANLYLDSNQYREAIDCYLRIIKIDPSKVATTRLLSICYQALSEYENSIKYTVLAMQHSKSTHFDYARLGRCYSGLSQLNLAVQNYKMALELEPHDPGYLAILARTFHMRNQFESAAYYYSRALEIAPEDYQLWDVYGSALLEMRRFDDAIIAYSKYKKLNQCADSANKLGWVYYVKDDFKLAIEYFSDAVKINPNDATYKMNLFLAYAKLGQADLLFSYIRSNQQKLFLDPMSALILAQLHVQSRNFKEAIFTLDELLEDSSNNIMKNMFLCLKATTYYESDIPERIENAIAAIQLIDFGAIDSLFINEQANLCLGRCFLEKGDYTKAIEAFKLAIIGLGESDAVAWNHLGVAYLRNDNVDEAVKCFERVMTCENAATCSFTYYILTKAEQLPSIEKKHIIKIFYLLLDQVYIIKEALRYEITGKSVYHYTSQETLANLLRKNARIRMSNSAYMNDPEEGMMLSRLIKENIPRDQEQIKPHSDTFLASFSENKDELSMWLQYAQNATGCSIGIGDDFFDSDDNALWGSFEKIVRTISNSLDKESPIQMMQKVSSCFKMDFDRRFVANISSSSDAMVNDEVTLQLVKTMDVLSSDATWENHYFRDCMSFMHDVYNGNIFEVKTEKYCLYKVCYIDKSNDTFLNIDTPKAIRIESCISSINKLLEETAALKLSSREQSIINAVLNECLNQIRFLFKSSDYRHEEEVRLVMFEPLLSDKVKSADREKQLPKLYIEIDKPIRFKELVLGAKIEYPDEIVPALLKSGLVEEEKISKSRIKYR